MNVVRILNRIFLVVSLFLLAAIFVLGIWFGYQDFQGVCSGIGDSMECSQWQFIQFQIFFAYAFLAPWAGWVLGAWLLMNAGNWVVKKLESLLKTKNHHR